jgi:hypothetical protein
VNKLTKQQILIAKNIGGEYQCNRPHISMGEARKALAYDVFKVEKWVDLSSEQREVVMLHFNDGVRLEKKLI